VNLCARLVCRQGGVLAAEWVDDRGQPGIGGANEIHSVFDSPKGGQLTVLVWRVSRAKPSVVGQIDEEGRTLLDGLSPQVGQDIFVADQRADVNPIRQCHYAACTGRKIADGGRDVAKKGKVALHRDALAEGEQAPFGVPVDDVA
jgi:hypothetical protein